MYEFGSVLPLPPDDPIPLSEPRRNSSGSAEDFEAIDAELTPLSDGDPHSETLGKSHIGSVIGFANAQGFGYVRNHDQVAGFQEHGFSEQRWSPPDNLALRDQKWRLTNLQLVSLLKFDTPAVYLSPNLPRMHELRDAPTRPLDAFERDALEKLRQGEDQIVAASADRMRMLGALRAARQCLDCHSVERGDLLGAFSYEFRAVQE